MSKKINKKIGIYILVEIVLLIFIIVMTLTAIGNKISYSSETSVPTFTDEDGKIYVVAFLKGMTESNITVDMIEFITDVDSDRFNELNLTEDDMPDGYYIYNPDEKTVVWELDLQTVYTFIDWNGDFTGSEYPKEYSTTDVQEFKYYIESYDNAVPGMPFFFEIKDDVVKAVLEMPFA